MARTDSFSFTWTMLPVEAYELQGRVGAFWDKKAGNSESLECKHLIFPPSKVHTV